MSEKDSPFKAYLKRHRDQIDQAILACVPELGPGAAEGSEVPRDVVTYLRQPYARFVFSGGKRTRPALALLGAEAVGAPFERALPVAAAVELFQTCALIHDDIADEGEMRRGQPCVHVSEGVGIALNVGDAALVSAFSSLLDAPGYDNATKLALLRELVSMERVTLQGQALDLGWARDGRWDVTVEDYLDMASRKTAHYSAASPLAMGAIAGGGTGEQVGALRTFGEVAGLAFQVADDLLNLVGDQAAQGKDFRSDVTEGKRTLVVVRALASLDADGRAELVDLLSSHATDPARLGRAVELMEGSGAVDYARDYALRLVSEAKSGLEKAPVDAAAKATLLSMADFFVERSS